METDESTNTAPEDEGISAGLRQAATWASEVEWELDPSAVMTRSHRTGFYPGAGRKRSRGIRLSPRIIWIAVIVAAIVVVATVPELSTHQNAATKPPGSKGHTRTSTPTTKPIGSGAKCKTTDHGVVSTPLGPISLPEEPGPIISQTQALAAAKSALGHSWAIPYAPKLSSWTEVKTVLESTGWDDEKVVLMTPDWVADAPWTPAWVVLIPADYSSALKESGYAVLVDAAPGSPKTYVLPKLGDNVSWFKALTDRDPSIGGCPGGSTAQVPFGVLTRNEEGFLAGRSTQLKTLIIKLTSIPAFYAADPGLFGGCIEESCTLDQLFWTRIEIVRAPAGHTIPYAPWSTPPGYHAIQVKEYFTISAPMGGESGPGPLPAAITDLLDLAPPGN